MVDHVYWSGFEPCGRGTAVWEGGRGYSCISILIIYEVMDIPMPFPGACMRPILDSAASQLWPRYIYDDDRDPVRG